MQADTREDVVECQHFIDGTEDTAPAALAHPAALDEVAVVSKALSRALKRTARRLPASSGT